MFVQQKNAQTGDLEWAVVDVKGEGEAEEALSSLLQTSLYLDMLHDKARNRAYRLAIEKAVQPGDHVLDIGTGTGLLALMAARAAGALPTPSESSPGTVTACELFPPMAKAARRIISENGVSNISVITKRSDEVTVGALPGKQADMPGKADVIVTEIFDSELLGEGILPTIRHAVRHLLKDGGRVVPAGAHVYGQLVECAVLEDLGGVETRTAPTQPTEEFFRPLHLDPLFPESLHPLSKPFKVFSFEFACPPPGGGNQRIDATASVSGRVTAVVMWWDLLMDADQTIILSTAPIWAVPQAVQERIEENNGGQSLQQQWRDHWKTCWAPLPGLQVGVDSVVVLDWRFGDMDISVSLNSDKTGGPSPPKVATAAEPSRQSTPCGYHWEAVAKAAQLIAGEQGPGAGGIVSGEPAFVDLISSSCPDMVWTAADAKADMDAEPASSDSQADAQIYVADPLTALCPQQSWHDLSFWQQRIALSASRRLAPSSITIPCRGELWCVGVSLPEFWRTHLPVSCVEGFDLRSCNQMLGVTEDRTLSQRDGSQEIAPLLLWQCGPGCRELTQRVQALSLDFADKPRDLETSVSLRACEGGLCHALVFWVEFSLDTSDRHKISSLANDVWTPSRHSQGVVLLRQPLAIAPDVQGSGGGGGGVSAVIRFKGSSLGFSCSASALP